MVMRVLLKKWMSILWVNVRFTWWNFVLYLLLLLLMMVTMTSRVAMLNPNCSVFLFSFDFMACILSFCMCSFCNKFDKSDKFGVADYIHLYKF